MANEACFIRILKILYHKCRMYLILLQCFFIVLNFEAKLCRENLLDHYVICTENQTMYLFIQAT